MIIIIWGPYHAIVFSSFWKGHTDLYHGQNLFLQTRQHMPVKGWHVPGSTTVKSRNFKESQTWIEHSFITQYIQWNAYFRLSYLNTIYKV